MTSGLAERWDAIIVGASFGGLAAAMELAGHGRVLLLDKDAIGEHQTSACATPVAVLERLQVLESLDQVHEALVLHLPCARTRSRTPSLRSTTGASASCWRHGRTPRSTRPGCARSRTTGC